MRKLISFYAGMSCKKENAVLEGFFLYNEIFQGEEPEDTMMWFKTLQFYTQCLGGWRRRRKGLANIMIDPNVAASVDNTYYLEAEEEVRRRRSSSWTRDEAAAAVEGASALPPTEG